MDEMTALAETLERLPGDAPTSCAGWAVHDLVAHLAAGAAEMADLVEVSLDGGAERSTRPMREREAPYVGMHDDDLRGELRTQSGRLIGAVVRLADAGPAVTVPFAGRRLHAPELVMHGRSEAALHRWDLVGSDDVSRELLARPELTAHAVVVMNEMLEGSRESVRARADAASVGTMCARFASPGEADVVITVDNTGARLEFDEPTDPPTVTADPASRLLALWGRRGDPALLSWTGADQVGAQLRAFLAAPALALTPV